MDVGCCCCFYVLQVLLFAVLLCGSRRSNSLIVLAIVVVAAVFAVDVALYLTVALLVADIVSGMSCWKSCRFEQWPLPFTKYRSITIVQLERPRACCCLLLLL